MKAHATSFVIVVKSAKLFAVLVLVSLPAIRAARAATEKELMAAESTGEALKLSRVEVTQTVLGSIGVDFAMNNPGTLNQTATNYWATVTEVTSGSTAQKVGFRPGDEIVRLNGYIIRGLTLVEFFSLLQQERRGGDLVWKINRGILGGSSTIVFNGKAGRKADQ